MFRVSLYFRVVMIWAMLFGVAPVSLGQEAKRAAGSSDAGCHEIAVIGAVKRPQRLPVQPGIRLLDLVTSAGGPTERAGKIIRLLHTCNCSTCADPKPKSTLSEAFNLVDVLHDRPDANPLVAAGDVVSVPEDDSVFI